MNGRSAVVALALVAALGLALAGSPAIAASPGAGHGPAAASDGTAIAAQQADNESELVHEHPERADGHGDVATLANWLVGEIATTLEESALEIERGEYDASSEALGDEFAERLVQYENVAADTRWPTEDETDPRTRDEVAAEEFHAIRDAQRELTDRLSSYEESLAAYEAARDDGDADQALEHARELVADADRIETLRRELDARYARVGTVLEADFSPVSRSLANRTRQTRREAARIAEDSFSATSLSVEVVDATVSPADPLRVEGRLVDEHGDPIPGATVAVADPISAAPLDAAGTDEPVGSGATTTVQTRADGTFELEHRPTFVRLDVEHLTVEYRPERASPHRVASETVAVDVQQVEGEVSVANEPSSVGFGDEVDVGLVASADGEPVPGVPFRLTVGDAHTIGVTDESGAVHLATTVPRDVPAGEADVSIDVPVEGWSVAFEPESSTVQVLETPTTLSAETRATGEGVAVVGRLTTAEGTAVADAPIVVEAAGSGSVTEIGGSSDPNASAAGEPPGAEPAVDVEDDAVATSTDDDGRFSVTVDASDAGDSLVVRYAEPDGNLESAETAATLPGEGGGALGALSDVLGSPLAWGVLVLVVWQVVGLLAWRRWRRDDEDEEPEEDDADEVTIPEEPVPQSYGATDLLEAADETLSESPERATVLAYGAAREALDDSVESTRDATHWEFYEACREDGLDGETVEAVRVLTERYEAAAYAPEPVDSQDARDAIAAAEHVR